MKCYAVMTGFGYVRNVVTPVSKDYNEVVELNKMSCSVRPIKLKPYTLGRKFRLIPAILAAKLARLVRKIRNRKCTDLENSLMRFYYEQEVKVRGYV